MNLKTLLEYQLDFGDDFMPMSNVNRRNKLKMINTEDLLNMTADFKYRVYDKTVDGRYSEAGYNFEDILEKYFQGVNKLDERTGERYPFADIEMNNVFYSVKASVADNWSGVSGNNFRSTTPIWLLRNTVFAEASKAKKNEIINSLKTP